MDDGDAIPAAPEDLMQMNEAQASMGGADNLYLRTAFFSLSDNETPHRHMYASSTNVGLSHGGV